MALTDIVKQAGVDLKQETSNILGTSINQTFGDLYTGETFAQQFYDIGLQQGWDTSNYAEDLINYQPKHRFLFKVLFDVDPELSLITLPNKNDFQYIIKEIDKPTISFDFEEVNYYNFRTKVLKKINHDPLSMTLIDDIQDTFYKFFMKYMSAYSPASRTWNSSINLQTLQTSGFNFSDPLGGGGIDSAIRGELPNKKINPFKTIRVQQFSGHGTIVNEYQYVNPRIIDFNFEALSHEGGDQGNHCTIRFDFDFVHVVKPTPEKEKPEYPVSGKDMFINSNGNLSPFIAGAGNGTGNFGSNSSSDISPFSGNAGGGIFGAASTIFSNAGNQVLNQGIQGIIPKVNDPILSAVLGNSVIGGINAIKSVGQNTLFGMTQQTNPNFVQPPVPFVTDEYR